jgi:hypothetical protein
MTAMDHVFPKNGIAIFFESHLDMQISVGFAQQIRFSAQGFSLPFSGITGSAPPKSTPDSPDKRIAPPPASVGGRERG